MAKELKNLDAQEWFAPSFRGAEDGCITSNYEDDESRKVFGGCGPIANGRRPGPCWDGSVFAPAYLRRMVHRDDFVVSGLVAELMHLRNQAKGELGRRRQPREGGAGLGTGAPVARGLGDGA